MRNRSFPGWLFVLGLLLLISGMMLQCRIERRHADTRAVVGYALDAAVVEYRPEGGN